MSKPKERVGDVPPLLGTYRTPRFRIGQRVTCLKRGEVVITGQTEAPIPWPLGKSLVKHSRPFPILYGALAKAVGREASSAIMHHFGVGSDTVWKWRVALGVGEFNEGTRRLKSENASEAENLEARAKGRKARTAQPERDAAYREKMAASKRGKPMPEHVRESIRKANTGRVFSAESRAKMSESHKRRGTIPPGTVRWTPEEDDAVRTLPPAEAAEATGKPLARVYARRYKLGVTGGRKHT